MGRGLVQAQSGTDLHSSPSRLTCVSFPGSCPFPDTDLNAVIQKGRLLEDIHKRCIFYQLLRATKFIHSGRVIHRDQKVGSALCPQVPGPTVPWALWVSSPFLSPASQRSTGCCLPGETL